MLEEEAGRRRGLIGNQVHIRRDPRIHLPQGGFIAMPREALGMNEEQLIRRYQLRLTVQERRLALEGEKRLPSFDQVPKVILYDCFKIRTESEAPVTAKPVEVAKYSLTASVNPIARRAIYWIGDLSYSMYHNSGLRACNNPLLERQDPMLEHYVALSLHICLLQVTQSSFTGLDGCVLFCLQP